MGRKQMLSIARAMAEDRELYLIDEPTKGLAPAIIATMANALRELKAQGAFNPSCGAELSRSPKPLGTAAAGHGRRARHLDRRAMAELAENKDLQENLMGLSMEAH